MTQAFLDGFLKRAAEHGLSAEQAIELAKKAAEIKPSHKGLLHKDLGIPQGQPIPAAREEEAKHSRDPKVRRRATFALNMRS